MTQKKVRRNYTDAYKAEIMAELTASGYPDNPFHLAVVSERENIPGRTIRRWFNKKNGQPPDDIVHVKKTELGQRFEDIAHKLLDNMDEEKVKGMSGQQIMTSAGIAVDKMRLLRGLPTEIIGIIPELVSALERAGEDPQEVFNRLIQRANVRAEQRNTDG